MFIEVRILVFSMMLKITFSNVSFLKHSGPQFTVLFPLSFRQEPFYLFCHKLLLDILAGSLRGLSLLSDPAGRPGGRRM